MSSPAIFDAFDQGTLDWAHSEQARHAEHVMGKLARQRDGAPMDTAFRDRMRKAAVAGGLDPSVIAGMIDRPALEKLTTFDEPDVRSSSATLVDMLTKTMRDATMDVGDRALLV